MHGKIVEARIEGFVPMIGYERAKPARLRAHLVVQPPEVPGTNHQRERVNPKVGFRVVRAGLRSDPFPKGGPGWQG